MTASSRSQGYMLPAPTFCFLLYIYFFSFLPLLALFLLEYNKKTTSYMFFLCTLYCNGHISVVILIWKTHCMPVYNGNLNPAGGSYFIFIEVVYRKLSTQMKCSDRKGGDMPWNQIMPDSQAASLRITEIRLSSQAFISLFLCFWNEWQWVAVLYIRLCSWACLWKLQVTLQSLFLSHDK